MSYIGNSPGVASQRVTTTLTATAGQTQFTTQSGYVLGYVDVYLNGVKLVNGADFEAITGTYITLFAGALAGDVVELVSYVPRGLTDGYTKAEADAKFLDVGGDTASGSLSLASASLTGDLTLSSGTVNGVPYLNASKVVTTGSALTFDGGRLTVNSGTTSEALRLNATANTYLSFQRNGTGTAYIQSTSGAMYVWNQENTAILFGVNNVEQMRMTSSGVGIGTSLPGAKLDVAGTGSNVGFKLRSGGNTGVNILDIGDTAGSGQLVLNASGNLGIGTSSPGAKLHVVGNTYVQSGTIFTDALTSYGGTSLALNGGSSLIALTSGTERMRLDSSGNLGLGVTPSAWGSIFKVVQTSGGVTFAGRTDTQQLNASVNWYYDNGTNRYIANGYASRYAQESGIHVWYNAPSGTAGNAISFTQAMTLDSSGKLGIGTTSPNALLSTFGSTSGQRIARFVQSSSSTSTIGAVQIVTAQATGSALDVGHWSQQDNNWVFRAYGNVQRSENDDISNGNFLFGITGTGNVIAPGGIKAKAPSYELYGSQYNEAGLNAASRIKLGTFYTAQGGMDTTIRLFVGSGYNALETQVFEYVLRLRTSNGSSSTAGSTGAIYINGFVEKVTVDGFGNSNPIESFLVEELNTGQYVVYVDPNSLIGNYSHYIVESGVTQTWVHTPEVVNISAITGNYLTINAWRTRPLTNTAGFIDNIRGIKFPASAGYSTDPNSLDDYEEGTWTPTPDGLTGVNYGYRLGSYVKVGKIVTVFWDFSINTSGGTGGQMLYGLPFTVSSSQAGYSVVHHRDAVIFGSGPAGTQLKGFAQQGTTYMTMQLEYSGVNGYYTQGPATYTNSGRHTGYCTYTTSD